MSEKYVVRLKNAAIYYADNPFGSTSEAKLLQRGEMVLSDVNLCVAPGEFVYLLGRVGSGKSTLLNDPQVLLADEPTGNLDPVTAEGIMQLFEEIACRGCAVVMSTHNTALIENHPARAILFSQGKIREVDLKAELG